MSKPNIILIMCDQFRGDALGIAGHPDVKTPYIDTLTNEGTFFNNAYSATPSCIPARVSLFTGQSQKLHGRVGYEDGVSWDFKNMFPEILSKNGYHTEMIGKMHVHPPLKRCGFNNLSLHDGYIGYYRNPDKPYLQNQNAHDHYLHDLKRKHGYDADVSDIGIECNSYIARPWNYDETIHPTNWVINKSIEFLEKRDPDEPFFLMSSFVRPHPPFDAPLAYFDMYKDVLLKEPARGDWNEDRIKKTGPSYNSPYGTDDEELKRQAMVGYYACITHIDHQIGRFLKVLDEKNILENSVVIFTSDHGELLFDHNLYRKVQPYQGSVHIPLSIRVGKNIENNSQMKTNKSVVELRDIAPTILDFANIEKPEDMDGLSLKDSLYKKENLRNYIHGEHSGGVLSNHYIVTEKVKYIWFSQTNKEQYFNLISDPSESFDLIDSERNKENIKTIRNILINELKYREEGYSDGKTLIPFKIPKNILSRDELK